MLPTLAKLFSVTIDELLGLENGAGKRRTTPPLQKQSEPLNRLPTAQQKVVMQMFDGVLSQTSR
jgi:hypothetical protein